MATVTLQNSYREMENENKLSAAAYVRAYRPWHSLYNVRLRVETNTEDEVSLLFNGQSTFLISGLDSVTVSKTIFNFSI